MQAPDPTADPRTGEPEPGQILQIEELHAKVLRYAYLILIVIGIVPFLMSTYFNLIQHWHPVWTVHVAVYVVVAGIFLFEKSVATKTRVIILAAIFAIMSIGAIQKNGEFVYGVVWLMAIPPVIVVTLTFRRACIFLNAVIIAEFLFYLAFSGIQLEKNLLILSATVAWSNAALYISSLFKTVFIEKIAEIDRKSAEVARARDKAEQATLAKSRFVSEVSHEIRTPLNGILGSVQTIDIDGLAPETADKIRQIKKSGMFLLEIVERLLDLSKIEAGLIESRIETFGVDDLLAKTFEDIARAKRVDFHTRIEGVAGRTLRGDRLHIQQIVFNLVGNALKFTETGSVSVRMSVDPVSPTKATLRIDVTDTGPGLSPDELGVIFTRYGQTASGAAAGGTGLGLSISADLASHLGGDLRVESEPGVGSTFTLTVPVDTEMPATGGIAAPAPQAAALPQLTVLVADDNTVNQLVARGLLEVDAHRVDVVDNGEAAVAALIRDPAKYDLVLMDVEMPVMNGVAATEAIRACPEIHHIPVIGLTANSFDDQRRAYLAAGMTDVLTKPICLDDLRTAIRDVVGPAPEAARA
jgi:signal transduction histidine kinase